MNKYENLLDEISNKRYEKKYGELDATRQFVCMMDADRANY